MYEDQPKEEIQPEAHDNSKDVICLVCGILSLIFCCCSVFALIPGIMSIVFFIKARKGGKTSGMAIGGLICAIIGIIGAVVCTVIYAFYGYVVYAIYMDLKEQGLLEMFQSLDQESAQRFLMEHYGLQ